MWRLDCPVTPGNDNGRERDSPLLWRLYRTGVKRFALSAGEQALGLFEQIYHRSDKRHKDIRLLHYRFPERSGDFLLHPGASPGVDQRYGDVVETFVYEIDSSLQGDPVVPGRHGHVPGLGYAVLDLPVGEELPDNTGASRPLEDARKAIPFRNCEAKWTGKKEGADIHEVEVLTGLIPGKLPVEVVAVEQDILAAQKDLSSGALLYLLYSMPSQRQTCGEVHRPFRNLL